MSYQSESTLAKRDYLVGRMIDGGRALYRFFSEVTGEFRDPREVGEEVLAEFSLTERQRELFRGVVKRACIAKAMVDRFKERYGIDHEESDENTRFFSDSRGLYRAVTGEEPPHEGTPLARHENIAIEFGFKRGGPQEDAAGYAMSVYTRLWSTSIEDIESGKTKDELAQVISYVKFEDDIFDAIRENTPLGQSLITAYFISPSVSSHELRHVIDHIIDVEYEPLASVLNKIPVLKELPADICSGADMCSGDETFLDPEFVEKTLKREFPDIEFEKEITLPVFDVDEEDISRYREVVREWDKVEESVRTMPRGIFQEAYESGKCSDRGISAKEMSFIISTIDVRKIAHRMGLIKDYFERHPKKAEMPDLPDTSSGAA